MKPFPAVIQRLREYAKFATLLPHCLLHDACYIFRNFSRYLQSDPIRQPLLCKLITHPTFYCTLSTRTMLLVTTGLA